MLKVKKKKSKAASYPSFPPPATKASVCQSVSHGEQAPILEELNIVTPRLSLNGKCHCFFPPANSYAAAARREDSEVTGTLTWANVANATFPARRGINCAVCYVYHGDAEATSPLQGSTLLRLFMGDSHVITAV